MKSGCKYVILLLFDRIGGAEKVLLEIGKYLASFGKDVEVIVLLQGRERRGPSFKEYGDNIRVYADSNNLLLSVIRTLLYLKRMAKKKQVFVFSSSIYTNALSFFIRNERIRFVARDTTIFKGRYRGIKLVRYKALYRFYKYIDLLIMQSDEMLCKNGKYIRGEIRKVVISNPINMDEIDRLKGESVDIDEEYILAVGRLIPEKGFNILIKAFSCTQEIKNRFKLIIIGEGKEYYSLMHLIDQLKLRNRVLIRGLTTNPYKYMKNSYFNVVSSIQEGFPNVLNEMIACNERIVVTRFNSEVDRIPGIIVAKPGDVYDLSEKMTNVLGYDFKRELQLEYLRQISIHNFMARINQEVNLQL